MVAVRNTHTAAVEGIAPGDVGEVDASTPGVQGMLRAGLLEQVDGDGEGSRIERMPTRDELELFMRGIAEERARAETTIAQQRERVADLERDVVAQIDRATQLEGELSESRARNAEMSAALEAANARAAALESDRAAATAPARETATEGTGEQPAADPTPEAKPARARRQG